MEAGPSHRPLPFDVTRLRDKPTLPALHRLSARLLRNHGVFTGKSCPSLSPALAPAARCSNPWDYPRGKDFLLDGCLRRDGKGPSWASASGPSPVQPRLAWGPLTGLAWAAQTPMGADEWFAILPCSLSWGVGPPFPTTLTVPMEDMSSSSSPS